MAGRGTSKQALNIVDRPLSKNKEVGNSLSVAGHKKAEIICVPWLPTTHYMATLQVPTVSLSAFAYLFSELIQYAMDRASSTTDLEER